ncbi:aspartate racemase [Neorhizobium sp. R1-B]|uniref:aspartate/glutamate racemase family protein n=1 Tax=unclassified Neorhizobium TaxID=2629175 RepID=UPI0010477BF2|nr:MULTISPECIES: aspartate/glutamate racemase family protein [unclassified Neorhizobium]TCV65466.1 aspartate racemase [Neorhizobium sp. S3-V5DH]TDX76779.1 aspartate racemase [Neorhizobium sp. R1-B]
MRAIGLIGGMSFESTAVYYRLINEMVRDRLGGLASANVFLHSVNFAEVVDMQKAGRWDLAAEHLANSASSLQSAGAECVLICTNTMHLVAPEVQAAVDVPVIHIIDETAKALKSLGLSRPLLLATRYTMEHGFYGERMKSLGIDVMVPDADDRTDIHNIIFNELCAGTVAEASRHRAIAMIEKAKAEGADSIILGCTEICLLLDPENLPLPGVDSTTVHAKVAVDFALGDATASQAAA